MIKKDPNERKNQNINDLVNKGIRRHEAVKIVCNLERIGQLKKDSKNK